MLNPDIWRFSARADFSPLKDNSSYAFFIIFNFPFLHFYQFRFRPIRARQCEHADTDDFNRGDDDDMIAEQMFDEANTFTKKKFAEYEAKKIPYTDNLFRQTVREQKQLAAKYATILAARENLKGEDFYYAGMLNWLADNSDNAADLFQKYLATENPAGEKLQTARSIIIFVAARQKKFDEAEKLLADYLKAEPVKLTERLRMDSELARNYRSEKNLPKAAAHAEEAYVASKDLIKDAVSRARALNELLESGNDGF